MRKGSGFEAVVQTHRLWKHFSIHVVAVLGIFIVHDLQDPPTDSALGDQSGPSRRRSSLSVAPEVISIPPVGIGDVEAREEPNPISVFTNAPFVIVFCDFRWWLGASRSHSLHGHWTPNTMRVFDPDLFSKLGVEIAVDRGNIHSSRTLPDALARLVSSKV